MKAIIKKTKEKRQYITYPCLMKSKSSDTVVLFIENNGIYGIGTVVYSTDCEVGDYSNDWVFDNFEPFHDTICLKN
jgi:hypothetical protein